MRKRQLLIIITLCLFATGCGTKTIISVGANDNTKTIEYVITQAPEEINSKTSESSISAPLQRTEP